MANVIKKLKDSGNKNILITERGASFGYNTLVSDMRSLPIMSKNLVTQLFSMQLIQFNNLGGWEKKRRSKRICSIFARAAVAVGIGALFMETHEDPDNAPSDGPNMVPLKELKILKN